MKAIRLRTLTKNMLLGMFTMAIVFSCESCSRKTSFLTSTVVPAARGTVTVKTDKNKNYEIKLQISDLAEPQRLDPPKATYVVWIVTDNETTKNIGQLNSSKGFMSKNLTGSLEALSSSKPDKIFITAEDNPTVQYPNREIILSTDRF